MQPVVYADIRCLQDPRFQFRGVGNHVASLLRQRREGRCSAWNVVGLVDDSLGSLPAEYAALVDRTTRAVNPALSRAGAVFIDSSPMTHDPRFTIRFTSDNRFFNIAALYDFIPLDWPGYLNTPADRLGYHAQLARLRCFDLYCPISEYTAWRLAELLGVSKESIVVTGAAVRSRLYEIRQQLAARPALRKNGPPYFISVGGGDRRKNTEVAVAAVRQLNRGGVIRAVLKVVGHYDDAYKSDLLQIAGHSERAGFLEFHTNVDDHTLVDLYSGAVASICPSHIEGFSLPVVESAVCGTPVIASMCGAHLELIRSDEALFESTESEALAAKLDRILRDEAWGAQLTREQANLPARFHETEVGARFWNGIAARMESRRPLHVHAGARKPRLAILTPYPPDRSGVARYTELTVQAATARFDIDIYTDARRPLTLPPGARDGGKAGLATLLKGGYESIISVIGNSHFHIPVFEFFEKYGGPCILHDSRLTHIYHYRYGYDRFVEFAQSILARPVTPEEVQLWLRDRDLPSLFVEPILRMADPLIVHTPQHRDLLRSRYGVEAQVTTVCPNMYFSPEEISEPSRLEARARLNIAPETFAIATFGFVGKEKGMDACIIAIDLLRGWGVPAELFFVGDPSGLESEIQRVASLYGVDQHTHWMKTFVDDGIYRDFMLSADAAVQLRQYGLGQFSAALADCISAGVPCVATDELAAACDAPAYVETIPQRSSPLQVAEALAKISQERASRQSHADTRLAYLERHNFGYYTQRLAEILGLA